MPDRQTVELVIACLCMSLMTTSVAALTGWRSGSREALEGPRRTAPPRPWDRLGFLGRARGGHRARAALVAASAAAAGCLASWWLLASADAAALRAALPLRPLAEVAVRLAPVRSPTRAGVDAADRAGLILLHPWPMDRAALDAAEAERIAARAAGTPGATLEGAVLASVRSRRESGYDCFCWVVFVSASGTRATGHGYVVLVDARDGSARRPRASAHHVRGLLTV